MATVGKQVGSSLYLHISALQSLPEPVQEQVRKAQSLTSTQDSDSYNVVKLSLNNGKISLLSYPGFFEEPFPALARSISVDLEDGSVQRKDYSSSGNPPILHRKELLLPSGHPRRDEFAALTEALCRAGLLRDAHKVGHRAQWAKRLADAGFRVEGHALRRINIAGEARERVGQEAVKRHKTAITRYGLSAPMQALARHGFLDGSCSVFDYGCGKGDDLKLLEANSIPATGWDPHHRPNAPKVPADIVNLGFVINIIEDPVERAEVVLDAFSHTRVLLSVAVIPASKAEYEGKAYRDGILTRRNTFQKFYTQEELRYFLLGVLDIEPVAVAPGVFFVFKDEMEEQRFLERRYANRSGIERLIRWLSKPTKEEKIRAFYEANHALLDGLWEHWLAFGRRPELEEVPQRDEVLALFGSLSKALRFLERYHGSEALAVAAATRTQDLSVYFALQLFERRRPYKAYPDKLRHDIRAFFGSHDRALDQARALLFSAGNPALVREACQVAAGEGLGYLEEDKALILHTRYVERLPPILRVYIGCGLHLYGDVTAADLVKIHIESAKLTLMSFDDFEGKPLPRMTERIKLDFRHQGIDIFSYGEAFTPPYLYLKSRYIGEDFPFYWEQLAFDKKLQGLGVFDLSGYGPRPDGFNAILRRLHLEVKGFELVPTTIVPDIDQPCNKYHLFCDFIECGETQQRTKISNPAKQP